MPEKERDTGTSTNGKRCKEEGRCCTTNASSSCKALTSDPEAFGSCYGFFLGGMAWIKNLLADDRLMVGEPTTAVGRARSTNLCTRRATRGKSDRNFRPLWRRLGFSFSVSSSVLRYSVQVRRSAGAACAP